jgi:Lipopolysaccharide-assembly
MNSSKVKRSKSFVVPFCGALPIGAFFAVICMVLSSCKIYSFKDVSIPSEVKSIHLGYLENRARLVNPQLAPQLNDKLRQKMSQQASKLSQIPTSTDADYDVNGWVSDYAYTTSGVSNQQASTNRLSVTVHLVFKNHLDPTGKKVAPADFEADVTRNFDFAATTTITDAEAQLLPTIVSNLTDEIFNKLFSNW